MLQIYSAHEADSDAVWYPCLSQEAFQWKPKLKGKRQKSQIDAGRTEISYSASTALGADTDFETSTHVSKDLGTPSSHSVESKRSRKRSKKSLKEISGSVHSAASAKPETPESSKEVQTKSSYLVTLECPLCDDADCILNKAAKCPLLRQNDAPVDNECCIFCGTNCRCDEAKSKFLPMSGLVQRDENGVAVTLLKANGGPIENSFEWANRRRWTVPSQVKWEHKISEWVTAPLLETSRAEEPGQRKRAHKPKSKRKSKALSTAAANPEQISNSEEPRVEEDDQELRLIIEGQGFKIFEKGEEKILINYDRKNCRHLGCSCLPTMDTTNCGCGSTRLSGEKTSTKTHKHIPNKRNVALLKDTSHGLIPVHKELEEKCTKEKIKSNDSLAGPNKEDRESQKSKPSLKPDHKDGHPEKPKKVNLSGQDIRNKSRANFLEASLRSMLGNEYKNYDTVSLGAQNQRVPDEDTDVPFPTLGQPGAACARGNLGPCICGQGCPSLSAIKYNL